LSPSEAWDIFQEIVKAMAAVHAQGIVHRDLKPENVFLDRQGKVLIGDWGLACRWSSFKKNKASCGSVNYAASEIVCRRPYTGPEVDMFSMGAILYTMLTGRMPFGAAGSKDTLRRVAEGKFYMDKILSPSAVSLLEKLFDPDPLRRATVYHVQSYASYFKPMEEESEDEEEETEDEEEVPTTSSQDSQGCMDV